MKKRMVLILAMVMALSLAGCSGNSGNGGQKTSAVNSSQEVGTGSSAQGNTGSGGEKTVVYNVGNEPDSYDPGLSINTATVILFQQGYDFLYRLDSSGTYQPSLAKSYEMSEDGLEYTFHLREGLKFSDGSDLTAEDVAYSWTRVLDPNTASEYAFIMYYIKGAEAFNTCLNEGSGISYEDAKAALGIEVVDPLTVKITLEAPTAYFLSLTGFITYAVLDKEFLEKTATYGAAVDSVSSSGPFKLTEWKKGEYMLFEKNENYWDKDSVNLDKIKMTMVDASSTELTLFDTGEIQATNVDMSTADILAYQAKGNLQQMTQLNTGWIAFNTVKSPLDDVRIRKALVYALDLNAINQSVIGGGSIAADGIIPGSMPSPSDPSNPFRTTSYINTAGDIEKAKTLLAEAGYPEGKGFPGLKLQYGASNDLNRMISEAMCAMWQQNLGITITPDGMEAKARNTARQEGDFDLCFQGWGADYADPYTFLECLKSSHYYNYGKYNSAEFDSYMNTAATSLSATERTEAMTKAEALLFEDMPILCYNFATKCYLQSDKLVNVVRNPTGPVDLKWADLIE
jgi:oligopeptide transport system substrate-binding protein